MGYVDNWFSKPNLITQIHKVEQTEVISRLLHTLNTDKFQEYLVRIFILSSQL